MRDLNWSGSDTVSGSMSADAGTGFPRTSALCSAIPRAEHPPNRVGNRRQDGRVQQPAPTQMAYRGLNGRFGQAGFGGNRLEADGQRVPLALCCVAQKIQVNDEGGGPTIVSHEVRHEDIDHVIVQIEVLHR